MEWMPERLLAAARQTESMRYRASSAGVVV